MTELRQADVAGALALVAEMAALDSVEEFPRHVLPRLRTLLRADITSFTHAGTDGAPVWTWDPDTAVAQELGEQMEVFAQDHPVLRRFVETGDTRATRVTDVIGLRDFQRLEIYDLCFRPLAARYQLAAGIALESPVPSGFGFTRENADFTERERTLLDLVRPHLARAYGQIVARGEARQRAEALERGLEADGVGLATVRGGRLVPLSGQASALLDRWFGAAEPPLPAPAQPVVVAGPSARLRLRLVGGDPVLVLLDEQRFGLDESRAHALGLTARETEILGLVARGLSDAEIARELFLSVRTIGKHLEHVYRKLGVATRDGAVAAVNSGSERAGRARDAV